MTLAGDGSSTQAGDHVVDRLPVSRPATSWCSARRSSPAPTANAFSITTTRAPRQRFTYLLPRPRSEALTSRRPTDWPSSRILSTTTSMAPTRAERDHPVARRHAIWDGRDRRTDDRTTCSKSDAIRGISSRASIWRACLRYFTSVNASGPTIAPIDTGVRGSSDLTRHEAREECVDRFLLRHIDPFHGVGEDEAVHADHDRERHRSASRYAWTCRSTASWLELGVQLHPTGVAHRHRVGMVVPDVDRRPDRSIRYVITIGIPSPEALNSASAMKSRPWLAVAV